MTLSGVSSVATTWPRDPYKGLNYFTAADAPLFGQREDELAEVTTLLRSIDTRVVLLHGGTGTGKSSFLRAGLGPRLQAMSIESGRAFFFLSEPRNNGSTADPLLVRATADPVARIFEALRRAGDGSWDAVSVGAKSAVRDALAGTLPLDRSKVVKPIITALKALTAPPQRNIFILLIDQAEEVLTLPPTPGAIHVREAFFELLEQICVRLSDLRVIIALRTEYHGRFCSYFRIRPTDLLTPRTEARAGLMDYLLHPLTDSDIAAAIRRPTLDEPQADYLKPPHDIYGFSYQGQLPELIAADLVRHSGEASPLPAMQIVCKQLYEGVVRQANRTLITEKDYVTFGRAEGVLEAYLVRALSDAADAAKLPALDDAAIDSWALVLARVVGRAEGGAVQTLIADEDDLITEAEKHGISSIMARAMLGQMVDPDRRLLRVAGGEGGRSVYSLGHDSLGPSVLRRSAQAVTRAAALAQQMALRAEAEAQLAKERGEAARRLKEQRQWWRLTFAVVGVVVGCLTTAAAFYVVPTRERVKTIVSFASSDQTNDFRERLLLLAAALRIIDTPPQRWFIDAEPAKASVREALLRSPVFAGTFAAAAWDADGQRIVNLTNKKLIVHDLETGKDSAPADLPPEPIGPGAPLSVGLLSDTGKEPTVVAFRTDSAKVLTGRPGSTLVENGFNIPEDDVGAGVFIPRADILHGWARVVFLHFSRTVILGMQVLQLSRSADGKFIPSDAGKVAIDWNAIGQQAFRLPVLAEDCDSYAFLSRTNDNNTYKLLIGQFGKKVSPPEALGNQLALGAVAIARGCGSVLVRDDSTLYLVPLQQPETKTQSISLDKSLEHARDDMRAMIAPGTSQVAPMFAAAPLTTGRSWRVAWPSAGGLAVVDVTFGAEPQLELVNRDQMLTGLESAYVSGSLSLSPDASHLLMTQQQSFQAPLQLRAFDLRLQTRRQSLTKLTGKDLVREACRIATFQNGANELTAAERATWLGDSEAPQPCEGIPQ